jgi:hypothetical protein
VIVFPWTVPVTSAFMQPVCDTRGTTGKRGKRRRHQMRARHRSEMRTHDRSIRGPR